MMHRSVPHASRDLEALMDERSDLQVKISLESDSSTTDEEKIAQMRTRLVQVEREIREEQQRTKPSWVQQSKAN